MFRAFANAIRSAVVAAFVVVALSGCLSSESDEPAERTLTPRQAAEELIGGPLAEQAGLDTLSATCPDVENPVAGSVFDCTAVDSQGRTVQIHAAVTATGQIELSTINVIVASALPSFEQAAIDALNQTVEAALTYDDIDCGEASVVIGTDGTMVCGLRDPQTEAIFDVTLTISDIERRQFSLVVADSPRR